MSGLRFYLFGSVRVQSDAGAAPAELTRTLQGLLAYLLLNRGRSHRRDALAGVFWGGEPEERARSCLSTALWRLRRALGRETTGPYLVTSAAGEVGFNCDSDYWLDVDVFESKCAVAAARDAAALDASRVADLESAVALYTGDALDGFYDDWALREKERLRLLFLNCLLCLMRHHRQHGALAEGASYGRRILQHDPLREEIHRDLIRLYLEMGERPLALRQYESCRRVLQAELGIPPMPETRRLYQQIVAGAAADAPPRSIDEASVSMQHALDEARLARRGLQSALDLLHRTLDLLEQHTLVQK